MSDLLDTLFDVLDDQKTQQRALLADQITNVIERRFCLQVCMTLLKTEQAERLIDYVCNMVEADMTKAIGTEEAKQLLGENVFSELVEEQRENLKKTVLWIEKRKEEQNGEDT